MRDDDQRAHCRREIVMRISLEAHVFSEIFRLHQLTDIVKVRTDAAERPVCTDRFGGSFGQISYHEAMVIGARRFDGHGRSNGWLRSDASSQEMSVVIPKRCSSIGSAPPTSVAVTIPLPIASALCTPSIPQSLAAG